MEQKYVQNQMEDEIDLLALARHLLEYWYLLLLGILVGANILGFLTISKPNTYTSYSSIFIQADTAQENTTYSDVQLSSTLSIDFLELANSKAVLDAAVEAVKAQTGIEVTRDQLNSMSTVNNTTKTRLLVFKVTSADPELSCAAAEALAQATAERVSAIMNYDEPTFVDHAEIEKANGKGLVRKVMIGAILGFLLVAAILIVVYLLDDKVVNEDDVVKYLGTNVLGTISLDKTEKYMSAKYKKERKKNRRRNH